MQVSAEGAPAVAQPKVIFSSLKELLGNLATAGVVATILETLCHHVVKHSSVTSNIINAFLTF